MWSRIRPRCAISLGKSIAVAFSNSRSPREYEFATDTSFSRSRSRGGPAQGPRTAANRTGSSNPALFFCDIKDLLAVQAVSSEPVSAFSRKSRVIAAFLMYLGPSWPRSCRFFVMIQRFNSFAGAIGNT